MTKCALLVCDNCQASCDPQDNNFTIKCAFCEGHFCPKCFDKDCPYGTAKSPNHAEFLLEGI